MRRQFHGQLFILRVKIIHAAQRFRVRRDRLAWIFPPLLLWRFPPLLDWNLPPPLAVIVPLISSSLALAPLFGGVMPSAAGHALAPRMPATTAKRAAQIITPAIARFGRKEDPALHATVQMKAAARLANRLTQNGIVPQHDGSQTHLAIPTMRKSKMPS